MSPGSEFPTPWRSYRKFAFPLIWLVIVVILVCFREILAPFIGAILIAYLLAPLVNRLSSLKIKNKPILIPRWVSVIVIYFAIGFVIWLYVVVAAPKVTKEFMKLAQEGEKLCLSMTPEKIEEYANQARVWMEESGLPIRIVTKETRDQADTGSAGFVLDIDKVIKKSVAEISEDLRTNLITFLTLGPKFAFNLFRTVLMTFLIMMVAAFLLVKPDRVFLFLQSLFPQRFHQGFQEVLHEIDLGLGGVVRGQVLICLINGVLTFIGLVFLGVKFPFMLSSLAAIMSLIPIFGSILSSFPIVAIALTSGLTTGLSALGWIIGIHLLEANLLNPKIIGDAARIHPGVVIFVLLAGEHFFGVIGALFAVPIASVAISFFKVFHRRAILWNQELYQSTSPPKSQGTS